MKLLERRFGDDTRKIFGIETVALAISILFIGIFSRGKCGMIRTSGVVIEPCASVEQAGWLSLRRALWPEGSDAEHLAEMEEFIARPERFAQFVAYDGSKQAVGFVEASIRSDYVNGAECSPVAFLEGIYVLPAHRRCGVARALVAAVSGWAVSRGIREFASDAALENELSHRVHEKLGFVETERVVYFRKALPESP